MAFSSLKLVVR